MKSAAFNLAFKVHRNEIPFAEGLLKSVEADAQHDFIEALNSLAGESRYDAKQLDAMIQEARTSLLSPLPPPIPTINIQAIREEITELEKKRRDHADYIQTLENRIAVLHTTVVPGVNSAMWGAVGLMMAMIVFLLKQYTAFLLVLAAAFLVIVMTYLQDSDKLKKEQAAIHKKKTRVMGEIKELKNQIEELDHQILEKQEQIEAALNPSPADSNLSESQPE
ncbi:MAG: hypothetical protein ACE15F_19025 [bacterium]